ncbi:MBL fold metallo-hydrolase [Stieleria varia]|uniref:Phosphoribosyl 1,2-cyclic phosphodiesterase n=1 Tax=Stieleria varia TaxID=2528005 RepID=A0A5C6B0X6_9BACT|nr:MBL fold metallo-hydrolase [Stieleria varia]TWU05109.1 Phosphoribosyl 1,2-cyclic phosphodiesterase [Stieleria varia]
MTFAPERSESADIGTAVLLGTGTSVGVPAIGCDCAVCQSNDPKNQRLRCAVLIRLPGGTVLIDTPPDLRTQLLRERVRLVHSVVYTHEHADHVFGLDDLRLFPFRLGAPIPLYCRPVVEEAIRRSYSYAFSDRQPTHPGATPKLEIRSIDESPFDVIGTKFIPIPMKHGPHFNVLGFRIGDFAYCTDTNEIPESSMEKLAGVQTLVVGALRYEPHPTHFNVEQAVEASRRVGATRTFLTHVSHELDYSATNEALPPGIELAYDGLNIPIRLSRTTF